MLPFYCAQADGRPSQPGERRTAEDDATVPSARADAAASAAMYAPPAESPLCAAGDDGATACLATQDGPAHAAAATASASLLHPSLGATAPTHGGAFTSLETVGQYSALLSDRPPASNLLGGDAGGARLSAGGGDASLISSLTRMMEAERRWHEAEHPLSSPTAYLAALQAGLSPALANDPNALKCLGAAVGATTSVAPGEGSSLTAELQAALLASAPVPDASSPLPPSRAPPLLNGGANKRRGPRSATSKFRGVSCYKRTGRWESHIWSNGKQVHLGSFRSPEEAARAYDMAAIMFRGWDAETNNPPECYRDDAIMAHHMQNDTTEQYVQWLRRGGKDMATPAVPPKPCASLSGFAKDECGTPSSGTRNKASRTSTRSSPGSRIARAACDASAAAAAAAAASAASFGAGILPSIPLLELCNPGMPMSAADEAQQLLLCSVTAPLHGDGLATLVQPLRSGTPSDPSGLAGGAYAAYGTHTSAGMPLSALVADGSVVVSGDAASDQSFADFARDVWPQLGGAVE